MATSTALFLACAVAAPAGAVVAVEPNQAAAGSVIDFKVAVTNDRQGVDLAQLAVDFPVEARPLRATPQQHPGWSASVDGITGRVSSVVWSGGALAAGASETFILTLTLADDTARLTPVVVLSFSDGTAERWGDSTKRSLAAVEVSGAKSTTTTSVRTSVTQPPVAQDTVEDKSDNRWGQLLMGVGIAVAAFVVLRARQRARNKS